MIQATATKVNPDYRMWVCQFNAAYHDYGMSEAMIYAQLGPEPPRYIPDIEEPHFTAEDFGMEPRL